MAWFAYSGLTDTDVDIGVKAWNIELTRNNQKETNDIVVSFKDIHPGMDTVSETVEIKNLGDSDASINYSIVSAKILADPKDNFIVNSSTISQYVEDMLSHNYPFHINISLSNDTIIAKTGESNFKVSVSWPLDSGNDEEDSYWGTQASNYKDGSPIQIVINITAEQYIEEESTGDINYQIGKTMLYDVNSNTTCSTLSSSCLENQIIGMVAKRKNLFNKVNPTFSDNLYIPPTIDQTYTFGTDSNSLPLVIINCKPNTTYTISQAVSTSTAKILRVASSTELPVVNGSITEKAGLTEYDGNPLTITTGTNDKYLSLQYYSLNASEEVLTQLRAGLQIEEGATATNYESYETIYKTISLLPSLDNEFSSSTFANYNSTFNSITGDWNVNKRSLVVNDILNLVSGDIINSVLVRPELSDSIIGNLKYGDRINTELNNAIISNGYYSFLNQNYDYLVSSSCYWTNSTYDTDRAFAIIKNDESTSKIYGNSKTNSCKIIPVIEFTVKNN